MDTLVSGICFQERSFLRRKETRPDRHGETSERARVGGVRVFDRFVVDWWWPWPTFKVRLVQQHGDSVGMGVGGVRKRRLILAN